MDKINDVIKSLIPYAEWTMLIFVIGGGIFLLLYSRFKPYRMFGHAIQVVRGKHDDPEDPGQISHLQALSSAVAATVGLGNISGVAIAIYQGGPGVVFWMWLTAIVGMVIKFYSCSLAVMYRTIDKKGAIESGPMHYMTKGIGKTGKSLAVFFSIAGLIGFLGVFTVNQFTQTFMSVVNPDINIAPLGDFNWKLILGLTLSLLTSLVIFGGLKKIARVATAIVPFMVALYFIAVIFIMATNAGAIFPSFKLIFQEAFNIETAIKGGFWGLVILGVRRAVFSNESGLGSAPMYHGESKTNEPVQEGLVAMLGPFIDTIVVCTLTALTIIISGAYLEVENNGIAMTLLAFEKSLYGYGDILLMLIVAAFAMSTLFTYSYYGTKCLTFLTNVKIGKFFNVYYIATITFAAITSVGVVINLIDLAYALMCIPNMIAVIYLSPKVNASLKGYVKKLKNEGS
ncbi:alanine/glycine:cation symporter family protein [Galbibacter pacificus]|uniref:Alanine/glycine:cation symporter family protein n=1 Tax=Galbibacter pacificus TaxID=2996052 RepID=A0ABT6FW17_9FLAO|nr:alanine/glycine:cation symporter family protein [Galbibacter pacificus]MDG3584127.1 alanine/glycine:cation symporter family protein [Galbibacter pacificus]MDG3587440.1 alanine/glycine:cation symporter family protein [Galbibacter pacificus]